MNKSDLIHEIFLFDKEIADYGIKKRVILTNNYILDRGVLYRKYGSEEVSARSLTDESKEKELLAFYEVFFSELDSNNSYRGGNTYAEKVLNFIKRTKSYDKFELVRCQQKDSEEYNSIDSHFKNDYNNKFLEQNKLYKEILNTKNRFDSLEYFCAIIFFVTIITSIVGMAVCLFTFAYKGPSYSYSFLYFTIISCSVCVSSYLLADQYFYKKIKDVRARAEEIEYQTGTFKDIDKKECFEEINKFYKDDFFYKELKKQYNITKTQSGNQITGD